MEDLIIKLTELLYESPAEFTGFLLWIPAAGIFLFSLLIIASDSLFHTKSGRDKLVAPKDDSKLVSRQSTTDKSDELINKEPDSNHFDQGVAEKAPPVKNEAPQSQQPQDVSEIASLSQENWIARFTKGMSKTKTGLSSKLTSILTGKSTLDEDILEDIHETLYRADIGTQTVDKLIEGIRKDIPSGQTADLPAVQACLKSQIENIFANQSAPKFQVKSEHQPRVILVVGVNGVGKTTTIGKLGAHFLAENQSIMFCAADTYRAAAIDQLKVWADRLQINIVAHQHGADPAAVAYDGVKSAMAKKVDNLIIDTAGRLHLSLIHI